jgi:Dyp-type peroxidase family
MPVTLDLDDIQGLLVRGYRKLPAAGFILAAVTDTAAARRWLGSMADAVTPGSLDPADQSLHLALTYGGLARLGLAADTLARFPRELVAGMAVPHRSRILGDLDRSEPAGWLWGGPATTPIDLALLLYARDETILAAATARCLDGFAQGGLVEVHRLTTTDLGPREHFGFRDGISQPLIEGLSKAGSAADTVRAGEFILGYRNEHGRYTERPLLDPTADPRGLLRRDPDGSGLADLGHGGSYLVVRQLEQDVRGFWRFLDRATRRPDGSADEATRVWLAAKMVGRWPGGAALAMAPDQDDPDLALANDFRYAVGDADGLRCPIGAHVRRTNPRDSLDPDPGTQRSIDVNKRHRLLRRGRAYGRPVPPETLLDGQPPDDEEPRGLHFLCLNANIARQFEFVQHTWANSPKFSGLYDDPDPIVAASSALGEAFTVQSQPVRRRVTEVPPFVTVRGGAYFYLPGVRAIRYLASLGEA